MIGEVYLIHFDTPYEHARHYLGWTTDLESRLQAHTNGSGARLMAAIADAGITWRVARTWPNVDRNYERKLKDRKSAPRMCPICTTTTHGGIPA